MGKIVLVTGGSKSGKSKYAENLAKKSGLQQILYIATEANQNPDPETLLRIEQHRKQRPATWKTIEEFKNLAELIEQYEEIEGFFIDCATLLVTNLFFDKLPSYYETIYGKSLQDVDAFIEQFSKQDRSVMQTYLIDEVERILEQLRKSKASAWIITNEVGMGIVPESALGRMFRDYFGEVNQLLATKADEVYFCVSGIPMKIK